MTRKTKTSKRERYHLLCLPMIQFVTRNTRHQKIESCHVLCLFAIHCMTRNTEASIKSNIDMCRYRESNHNSPVPVNTHCLLQRTRISVSSATVNYNRFCAPVHSPRW